MHITFLKLHGKYYKVTSVSSKETKDSSMAERRGRGDTFNSNKNKFPCREVRLIEKATA